MSGEQENTVAGDGDDMKNQRTHRKSLRGEDDSY